MDDRRNAPGEEIGQPFNVGEEYKRTEIHDEYGGTRYSGIAPCRGHPFVLLFFGEVARRTGTRTSSSTMGRSCTRAKDRRGI